MTIVNRIGEAAKKQNMNIKTFSDKTGLAYNTAHDVALPGSTHPKLGFLMYPQAERASLMLDCHDPNNFKYVITAKEVKSI